MCPQSTSTLHTYDKLFNVQAASTSDIQSPEAHLRNCAMENCEIFIRTYLVEINTNTYDNLSNKSNKYFACVLLEVNHVQYPRKH